MIARDKKHFITTWNEEIDKLILLANSTDNLSICQKLKVQIEMLKEIVVKIANETYDEKVSLFRNHTDMYWHINSDSLAYCGSGYAAKSASFVEVAIDTLVDFGPLCPDCAEVDKYFLDF